MRFPWYIWSVVVSVPPASVGTPCGFSGEGSGSVSDRFFFIFPIFWGGPVMVLVWFDVKGVMFSFTSLV